MSQPTPYTPTTDFSQQEANNASGRSTVNTAALDAEFAALNTTLDQTLTNLQLIQRDDTRLADGTVYPQTLTQETLGLIGGFVARGEWQTATTYAVNDLVYYIGVTYLCTTAHVSTTFDSAKFSAFANYNSSGIQFTPSGSGAVTRTTQDKMRDALHLKDFAGVDPTGIAECSASVLAAITAAIAQGKPLDTSGGTYLLGKLTLTGVNGLQLIGNGVFKGQATGSYTSLVDFVNCSKVVISDDITFHCSYNQGYDRAIWVRTTGVTASQYFDIDISINAAKVGIQFGDSSLPDAINSEHKVNLKSTYGVVSPVVAVGANTFVDISGNVISNSFGGDVSWQALTQTTIDCIGAVVRQVGGELQHASATTGSLVRLQPIASTGGTVWGQVYVASCATETAAPLATTFNPGAFGAPVVKGILSFIQCTGYHSQDLSAFVLCDSTYEGDVVVNENYFYKHTGGARTNQNVFISNALANIYVDDKSFGVGFVQGLAGITGGIVHFTDRMILKASNTSSQALTSGVEAPLKWQSLLNTQDTARFSSGYSTSTGRFTVPAGGLKSVRMIVTYKTSAPTQMLDTYFYVDNAFVGGAPTMTGGVGNSGLVTGSFDFGDMAAGSYLETRAVQYGGGSTVNLGIYEHMTLFARN